MSAKVGPPILVRLPADVKARVDLLAAARGVSTAELVRRALAEYLDREGQA